MHETFAADTAARAPVSLVRRHESGPYVTPPFTDDLHEWHADECTSGSKIGSQIALAF